MDLALYLLRNDLEEGSWGLRGVADEYEEVAVKKIPGVEISLYVRPSKVNVPRWQQDLLTIAMDQKARPLLSLQNQNTGALLLIERRGRRFVLVYGAGRHAVDSSAIETGFGLRVTANVVEPDALKGLDTRSVVGAGRSQTVSIPSAGPLHDLGIEPTADLVRYLEGKPPAEFASGIAGGDVLRLNLKSFSLFDLPSKLDAIVAAYSSSQYKENFPFLDYFTRVPRSNSEMYSRLNFEVDSRLLVGSRNVDFMDLDIDREDKPEKYVVKFGRKASPPYKELTKAVVLDLVSSWKVSRPLTDLKVHAYFEGWEHPRRTSLLPYVVGDVEVDGKLFAPCAGAWYRIDMNHLKALDERIGAIPDMTDELGLVPWTNEYKDEGDYNQKARPRGEVPVVLDKKLFYNSGGRNLKVEVCDLLTKRKELICIKKMTDSATLSHLLAQGSVSARLFRDNYRYRETVLAHLKRILPEGDVGTFGDWTIVFGIATDKPGRIAKSLFFFSKVNLEIAARAVYGAGMRLAVAKIDHVTRD